MEQFFRSKTWKILLVILAILFGFMLYSASREGVANIPQKLLSYVTMPVQKVSTFLSNGTKNFLDKFTKYDETLEENNQLHAELNTLRQQLIEYESLKRENEQLKTILDMHEENEDYEFKAAMVIGRDPDDKSETFTIDQGSLDGVDLFAPVITADGLVGYIDSLGPRYAVVRTILSTKTEVGAYEVLSNSLGVVKGDPALAAQNLCQMLYLEQELSVGELVVTTGSSGMYPKGLVIGTVQEVQAQKQGTSFYALLKPANDVTQLQEVFIITDFAGKNNADTPDAE